MRGLLHGEGAAAEHAARTDNPHAVTAAQAGADTAGSAAAVRDQLAGHTANLDNPHQVKASQIPCLPWDNVLDAVSDINNQLNATAETQYRWQKYKYALQEVATNVSVHVYCYYRSQGEVEEDWSLNAYYASNGAYTFDDTTGLVITGTNAVEIRNNLDAIKGKYILINKANGQTSPATPGVPLYYVPITAEVRSSSSSGTNWSRRNYYLEGITQYAIVKTDVENLYSASEDTYPKNISQGGYYYQYLGTESTKVLPRIITGQYTGSGTYGAESKNSLTFPFVPKLVIIQGGDAYTRGILIYPSTHACTYSYGTESTVAWNDASKTVSWYSTSSKNQLNTNGSLYHYVAIG